jgi:hypothetical protein
VLVPKAAVHQNQQTPTWQDDVGLSGQIGTMQSKAIAELVQEPPHHELRPSVDATIAAHCRSNAWAGGCRRTQHRNRSHSGSLGNAPHRAAALALTWMSGVLA